MQGVDRLDLRRAGFAIADGHSFKKWYKKLAMAIIDIARCSAYCTRKLSIDSSQALKAGSRAIRGCAVCKFEARYATECTDYYERHRVCLCRKKYSDDQPAAYMCPDSSATCWQKYHHYYFPQKLFNSSGRIMRESDLYLAHSAAAQQSRENPEALVTESTVDRVFDLLDEGVKANHNEELTVSKQRLVHN
ncbi:TPA: hypothetical protein N0F65_004830 [Lagenidium giganteum]|uniref:Uncharacterized protein n=1 Tax=Lagenidium giganteum TaxID=4803 RepID=A0AAV2ZC68_9STRA|nr:TPA: hypothetical protein N0F65_004830 [Lagenidium giganteum]